MAAARTIISAGIKDVQAVEVRCAKATCAGRSSYRLDGSVPKVPSECPVGGTSYYNDGTHDESKHAIQILASLAALRRCPEARRISIRFEISAA